MQDRALPAQALSVPHQTRGSATRACETSVKMRVDITYRYAEQGQPVRAHPSDSDAAVRRLCDGNRAFAALFANNADDALPRQAIVPLDPRDVGIGASSHGAPKQRP